MPAIQSPPVRLPEQPSGMSPYRRNHCVLAAEGLTSRPMKHQLDFEKPIVELQTKLAELKKHPETHSLGVSFEEEVALIEKKLEETKRQIFSNLSAWDRIKIARHPHRPFTLDYLRSAFADFSELHGDRLFAEDRAMVGGFACLGQHKVMVIGTQKGRDAKENILRNFG